MTVSRASRRALSSAVVEVTDVESTGDIIITFSEAVDPLTVTNVGNGSGSMEFKQAEAWLSGSLYTSDNITWSFKPDSEMTAGVTLTVHLSTSIQDSTDSTAYSGPSTIDFNVTQAVVQDTFFSDDFTSFDTSRWTRTNSNLISQTGSKVVLDTYNGGAGSASDVEDMCLVEPISKTLDAKITFSIDCADAIPFKVTPLEAPAVTFVQEESSRGGLDAAKLIWWTSPYNNTAAAESSITGIRFRYWTNTGSVLQWDEATNSWSSTGTVKAILCNPTDDITQTIEIDNTNTRWRAILTNDTQATTETTDWVLFSATRDLSVGSYFFYPLVDTSNSYKFKGSINSFTYEAL